MMCHGCLFRFFFFSLASVSIIAHVLATTLHSSAFQRSVSYIIEIENLSNRRFDISFFFLAYQTSLFWGIALLNRRYILYSGLA
jgi:hypothetical protein